MRERPSAPLQFKPAERLHGWAGERDATDFGPASAQVFEGSEAEFQEFGETGADRGLAGQVDSLTLNVWRAQGTAALRPVIIWIHGGANWLDGSRSGFFDGTAFARRGTVFVSMNYRLGVFGFLYLSPIGGPGEAHGHGLTDQRAAIDWVVDTIAAFGGDPANFTLMGNSAGTMDISWHIAGGRLPTGVRRVVMSSGVDAVSGLGHDGTASVHDPEEGQRRAAELLGAMGYTRFADQQAAPTAEILTRQAALWQSTEGLPQMDTLFYPRTSGDARLDPFAAAAGGAGAHPDVMIGFTADEMGLWLLWDDDLDRRSLEWAAAHAPFLPEAARAALPELYRGWFPDATEGQCGKHLLGDVVFALPSLWFADSLAKSGARVHAYRMDWATDPRFGALHEANIAFMLGVQDQPSAARIVGVQADAADRTRRAAQAETMMGAVTGFAASGTPMLDGQSWPRYAPDRRRTVLFDAGWAEVDDPMRDRRVWWTQNVLPATPGGGED